LLDVFFVLAVNHTLADIAESILTILGMKFE
jgi:hypothetical protein